MTETSPHKNNYSGDPNTVTVDLVSTDHSRVGNDLMAVTSCYVGDKAGTNPIKITIEFTDAELINNAFLDVIHDMYIYRAVAKNWVTQYKKRDS